MSSARREKLPGALSLRLGLWYAALFGGGALALIATTYALLSFSLQQRDRDVVRATLARYASAYERGGLGLLERVIEAERAGGRYEPLFVRVLGGGAQAVYFSMPDGWTDFDVARLRPNDDGWAQLSSGSGGTELEVLSAPLPDGALFQVGKSTEPRAELLARVRRSLLVAFVLIGLIAAGGGYVLTRSALQPLRDLGRTVRDILETGRLGARVPVRDTADPLDELGAQVNALLDRIEGLIAAMRGSLDNVAHDLRTPMMRLRAAAEAGLRTGPDARDPREALADCLEEAERVAAMLDTLMDISEAEVGAMRLSRERLELAEVVRDAVTLYSDVAEDKHIAVQSRCAPGVCVSADRNRMRQVVANLLDNAIKYTPPGGRVEVQTALDGAEAVLTVTDTGAGIPSGELPRIWERLYRGDASRSERGLGLGLSLVKAIVEAHGGRVEATSAPGQGSTFVVRLPAC
ncbi:MAG TPA: HAMP domain-containing sensor histidine kinase [Vicinamibacteria bacterium]|nr:HAMP domain-containing sensor histidine kinase [Vicinamibacteria bacterium]